MLRAQHIRPLPADRPAISALGTRITSPRCRSFTQKNTVLIRDWPTLDFAEIEDGGSLLAADAALWEYVISLKSDQIDTAVGKDKWEQLKMKTAVTNAAYSPLNYSINILAAWHDGFFPWEGANYSGQQVQAEAIADWAV